MRTDESNGMRVVDHNHRIVLVGQLANGRQVGNRSIHGENSIGCDQSEPRSFCLLKFAAEIVHGIVLVAQSLSFAQPDAIDDAGVVEFIGDDCIFGSEDRFKESAVGVPAGVVEDRIFLANELADLGLEVFMDRLRAADEADRSQSISPAVERIGGGLTNARMLRESEIVIRAKIEIWSTISQRDHRPLGRIDHPFGLESACFAHRLIRCGDAFEELCVHALVMDSE